MHEYITEALVLKTQSSSNKDHWINLYTKDLGKIKVKSTSGGKITSKLSPHLDVLNLSTVRLVNKNIFLITDALTKNRFENIRKNENLLNQALETISLIENMTPFNMIDNELWYHLISSLEKSNFNNKILLKILGYDPKLATCMLCKNKNIKYFVVSDQDYVCKKCSLNINENDKFLIN